MSNFKESCRIDMLHKDFIGKKGYYNYVVVRPFLKGFTV